jgi:hypothetical protein
LQLALARNGSSPTIQLNNLRLAVAKSKADPAYDPSSSWRLAFDLLNAKHQDRGIGSQVAAWYVSLIRYKGHAGNTLDSPSDLEIDPVALEAFEVVRQQYQPSPPTNSSNGNLRRGELTSTEKSYFLEPFANESET